MVDGGRLRDEIFVGHGETGVAQISWPSFTVGKKLYGNAPEATSFAILRDFVLGDDRVWTIWGCRWKPAVDKGLRGIGVITSCKCIAYGPLKQG